MILKKGLKKLVAPVLAALAGAIALNGVLTAAPDRRESDQFGEVSGTTSCDPFPAGLFTPRKPRLGRYEVCVDRRPLAEMAPRGTPVEAVEPFDAFGAAGAYDRLAVARLYGGTRARVARVWSRGPVGFESVTLISPFPDPSLIRLQSGTLVIRWFCDCGL